ncbi:aminodeoxychorismate lyase [Idiomarina seosinensis]|uniref:Aminodeoxychorismate lyase n=1 Tax=Idiomarina seosinensis TaxID=281739 RepID=A0A432ZHZ5_9GAMM|nr:aminodeoxychorismate lyase [Idiomarina seosinensis]RUO77616.1 aminodeoxychorismate lyase [Idiomarina seosinensis]
MSTKYWANGEQQADGLDRGLQFGDGHFTTVRVNQGKPLWWEYHIQRLAHANKQLLLPTFDRDQVEQYIQQAVVGDESCAVKIIVTRGTGGRGYTAPAAANPCIYLVKSPLPKIETSLQNVVTAEIQLGQQPRLAGLKTLNRLEQVLLASERQQREVDDLLVLDQQNSIIEACQGNLFWQTNKGWFTPKLEKCGVDGVARQVILANQWLGSVTQSEFTIADIEAAETVFVCNSLRGAVPIKRLNGKVLNTSLPLQLNALIE